MTPKDTEKYCLFAIDVLYSHLYETENIYELEKIDIEYPLFVTWKTEKDHELRGCIGTTNPINLIEGLRQYSIKSALEDHRFSPIEASELESLVCSISLLTDYEKCSNYMDWTVGKHGISIKFEANGRIYHAIFLPEVMIEHDLDHKSTLDHLIRKSGYSQKIDESLLESLEVTRFQSRKASVEVKRYIQIRKNDVNNFYYEDLRKALNLVVKKSDSEGLTDLNCVVIKVPINLDYSHLIDYNPEFYDYFNSASPEELKGLIRESVLGPLQEMISNIADEIIIDKRQISVELFMKNLPCSSDLLLESSDFYQSAIPKIVSDNLELKGSWDSHANILIGKVVSLSESFYLSDIQTYACSNPKCRNNQRVIRHVGLDYLEQTDELGPNEITPEVFVSSTSRFMKNKKSNIKCHNCREEIEELYPFRSTLEFKIAKIKLDQSESCFTIDLLLVGSMACSTIKLSDHYSFIGYPKLTAEIPHQLKQVKNVLKQYYFEVYGADPIKSYNRISDPIKKALDWLTLNTCEQLRFALMVILYQVIGSANGINFDVCLPGIDNQIIYKISRMFNLIFDSGTIMGSLKSNSFQFTSTKKQKSLKITDELYPNLVNILTDTVVKKYPIVDDSSFMFTNAVPGDQLVIIPIELTLSEEADILLKQIDQNIPKVSLPVHKSEIPLSDLCAKNLQKYFLHLRSVTCNIPMKFSLSLLSKLSQISALNLDKLEADQEDAEFAVTIHTKIVESTLEARISNNERNNYDITNQIMSPSISFDFGNEEFISNKRGIF